MGIPTQSVWLDGNSDYISVADHADFDITDYMSCGLWFAVDHDETGDVVLIDRDTTFQLGLHNGRPYFTVTGVGTCNADSRVPLDQPVFLAAIAYESGTSLVIQIIIGDSVVKEQTFTGAFPAAAATAMAIGATTGGAGSFLKGIVSSIFMTDDMVYPGEIFAIYRSAAGQATGLLSDLVIDIDTEGDVVNAGSAGAGALQGTAAQTTYLHIWQSFGEGRILHIPEGEVHYITAKKIFPSRVTWTGDTIGDGDILILHDSKGNQVFKYISVLDDQGGTWYFDNSTIWKGLVINTLTHGDLEIEVR